MPPLAALRHGARSDTGRLAGKTELVIVPDAILWDLPFQALQPGPNRYLIEDAAVSYAPSVTVLREAMRRRPTPRCRARCSRSAIRRPWRRTGRHHRTVAEMSSASGAEDEVKALALMYGASSRVYIGDDASEERWKAEVPELPRGALAAHGVLDNSSPMYSHLRLAAPGRGSAQDGLLEAWEIMNVQLDADLVVLSACETARGQVAAGEGSSAHVGDLRRWFPGNARQPMAGGVEELVRPDARVSPRVERRGNGTSKARALQLASLKLLQAGETSHPFHWAGFVLVGDGR